MGMLTNWERVLCRGGVKVGAGCHSKSGIVSMHEKFKSFGAGDGLSLKSCVGGGQSCVGRGQKKHGWKSKWG